MTNQKSRVKEIICIKQTGDRYTTRGQVLTGQEVRELQSRPGTVVILVK